MSDPITTIAGSLPAAAGVVATVFGVAKPFLTKILGPAAEEIGELGRDYIKDFRARNVAARLANADKLLSDAGIEAQYVSPKVLVPLLESASLEEDPLLSESWDALLANAANPYAKAKVDGNLVDILKQLNHEQALILFVIETMLENSANINSIEEKASVYLPEPEVQSNLALLHEVNPSLGFDISQENFYVGLDNLARLRLCTLTGIEPLDLGLSKSNDLGGMITKMHMFHMPGRANISVTYLGLTFLAACKAPKRDESDGLKPSTSTE